MIAINSCNGQKKVQPGDNITPNKATALRKIDSLFKALDYYRRFSGSVLIASDDSILYQSGFGFSDFEKSRKNNCESVYGIGSCTKQFTAAAILKLVQENRIKLDNTLSYFFPELGKQAEKITVEHLLTHSSGILKDFGQGETWDEIIFPGENPIPLDSLLHFFGEIETGFTPGNKFEYCNFGYNLLAGIVHKVTSMDYPDYLSETFFKPFGLTSTVYNRRSVNPAMLSKPYSDLPLTYTTPPYWDDSWTVGASGIYSTTNDLYYWMKQLSKSEVLSKELTDKMFSPHQFNGKDHYGYGWHITTLFGNEYIYHDGGTNGYYSKIGFVPSQDLYVVLLTNHTHNLTDLDLTSRLTDKINMQVMSILFNKDHEILPVPDSTMLGDKPDIETNVTVADHSYMISTNKSGNLIIKSNGSYSLLDFPYCYDLKEDSKRFSIVTEIVKAYGNHDFREILSRSTSMLKMLVSEEKLAEIWEDLAGETGSLVSWNCYKLPSSKKPDDYYVRMVFEKTEIGLQLVFKKNKINGMFTDKTFTFNGPKTIEGIRCRKHLYFIDGFKYNHPDGIIYSDLSTFYLKVLDQVTEINGD